jgi:hypothetical protein
MTLNPYDAISEKKELRAEFHYFEYPAALLLGAPPQFA